MKNFKKVALAATCAAMLGGVSGVVTTANAANWLMLQGTEKQDAAPRAKVWGFIQAKYEDNSSTPNAGGGYVPPKLVGPALNSQSTFAMNRARIGVRGQGMPLDGKVNYFFLAEFGNNGITNVGNTFAKVTDASITLNHIDGARVRLGLFKTPGSEEVYQGIAIFDYINFSNFANQQLIERSPNDTYTANVGPQTLPVGTSLNTFTKGVSAARDTGIQVFDTFKSGKWEHSYSVMVGNGNGLNQNDNDDNQDTYLYWSSEQVFAGKGPRRQGVKYYAWSQSGTRLLDNTDDATHNPLEYDRKRSGVGLKYLDKSFRVTFEYAKADGMIWLGPHTPTFDMSPAGPGAIMGNGEKGEASAWQVDVGYFIPNTKWELDARYDVYNRLENDAVLPGGPNIGKGLETEWTTLTLGVQYHLNKKTRLTVNYAMRDVTAVDWADKAGPNANLDGIDDVLAMQVTHIF